MACMIRRRESYFRHPGRLRESKLFGRCLVGIVCYIKCIVLSKQFVMKPNPPPPSSNPKPHPTPLLKAKQSITLMVTGIELLELDIDSMFLVRKGIHCERLYFVLCVTFSVRLTKVNLPHITKHVSERFFLFHSIASCVYMHARRVCMCACVRRVRTRMCDYACAYACVRL